MVVKELLRELDDNQQALVNLLAKLDPAKKPLWWEFPGLITGVLALAMVVVTAISGYLQQVRLKVTEESLTVARERRVFAREVALRAGSSLAAMHKVNDERTQLAQGAFDVLTDSQLRTMSRGTNAIQTTWRQQRQELEVELDLAFDAALGVATQFVTARAAVDSLTKCIEQVFVDGQGHRHRGPMCPALQMTADSSLAKFRNILRDAVRNLP